MGQYGCDPVPYPYRKTNFHPSIRYGTGGNTAVNSYTGRIAAVHIHWNVEGAAGMMDRGERGGWSMIVDNEETLISSRPGLRPSAAHEPRGKPQQVPPVTARIRSQTNDCWWHHHERYRHHAVAKAAAVRWVCRPR